MAAVPNQKPNEIYYFDLAMGAEWVGTFTFQITSFSEFLRSGASLTDQASALALHVLCPPAGAKRLFDLKNTVVTGFQGQRSSGIARSHAEFKLMPLPIGRAITIYKLRGYYRLDPNGTSVAVQMDEEYGPIPYLRYLLEQDVPSTAQISNGGYHATYQRALLGSPWTGNYEIAADGESMQAVYTSAWGQFAYQVQRGPAPLTAETNPGPAAEGLVALGKELDRRAQAARAQHDLLALFSDLYSQVTFALADGLGSFDDPAWVARLGEAFGKRYLAALDGYESGGYVPRHWKVVFDAVQKRRVTELDVLMMSIYAHISADLPQALADSSVGTATAHIEDFNRVTDVLTGLLGQIEDDVSDLYNPLFAVLPVAVAPYQHLFVDGGIEDLRAVAWFEGIRLGTADRGLRLRILAGHERNVEEFVSDLLDPTPWPLAVAAQAARDVFCRFRRW
jgi:Family of unknown function (DUF5995)